MRMVPTKPFLPMLLALGAAACAGGPPIVTGQSVGCSSLVPEDWAKGVDGAPLPADDSFGEWVAFGDAQTGRLDVANDRTRSAIGIVQRCEARDARAVKRARRGFLARLVG